MNDETPTVKRPVGRPRKVPLVAAPVGYPFPTLDDIMRMSDQQVLIAFDEIGAQPSPFHWDDDDAQHMQAQWHSFGRLDASEPRLSMAELKLTAREIHEGCLRTELLLAHLQRWIATLEDGALIVEVERLSGEKMSESAKRYAKASDMRQQLSDLTWPVLLAASTLYVWPINPLTGKSTKDEAEDGQRIPRPHD